MPRGQHAQTALVENHQCVAFRHDGQRLAQFRRGEFHPVQQLVQHLALQHQAWQRFHPPGQGLQAHPRLFDGGR
ncbi:MAG: hypothetical protein DWH82_05850 [Planctomycetota bacterium]|nr:MAG: hypothetical protein DWH82_05850 [Planctomycetota bacterium]